MIGTTLGRFRILDRSARAAWAGCISPRIRLSARKVAIKVLPPEFSADRSGARGSCTRRAPPRRSTIRTSSTVHDLGDEAGRMYVAMELIDGQTLRQWAGAKRASPAEILRFVRQATRGLRWRTRRGSFIAT